MGNQKRVTAEKKSGEFHQMFNRITNDKRLSGNAYWVLSYIISNSPTWSISAKTIQSKLGVGKDAVSAAFLILEECGYVKRTKMARGFFYEVSEYGNLNATPEEVESIIQPEEKVNSDLDKNKLNKDDFYRNKVEGYLTLYDPILDEKSYAIIGTYMKQFSQSADYYAFKSNSDKVIRKIKDKYHDKCLGEVRLNLANSIGQSAFKKWLKNEIYNLNNLKLDCPKKFMIFCRNHPVKKKVDFETAYIDKKENPLD